MSDWLDRRDPDSDDVPSEWTDSPSDVLVNARRNWELFSLCQSVDWAVLPRAGGWEDQDEGFIHDVSVFSRRIKHLRGIKKRNEKAREEVASKVGVSRRLFKRRRD